MSDAPQGRFVSPLRYPGGKGKVANYMKLLFLENDFTGYRYVEPYAGGATVALALLYEEFASHIYINDLNPSVYAFWRAVLDYTDALCARIADRPVTIEEWHRQKAIQDAADPDPLDLAFSTFFLNRTNRSGIIKGGVIGGKGQGGAWKLDARYNKANLILRVQKIARFRSRITLMRRDAAEFIRAEVAELPAETFVYLDPPYYVKGEGLYQHSYRHEDHEEIARCVRGMAHPWVVSYDAAPEILEMYAGLRRIRYDLSYSAADRYRGDEVMFFAPCVDMPCVETPSTIPMSTVNRAKRALYLGK